MSCRQMAWPPTIAAAAVVAAGMVGATWVAANPYSPTVEQIQGMTDVTDNFHGPPGQLSTIDDISFVPGAMGGIELTVTFRVGTGACDPLFGCEPDEVEGLDFPRVSLGFDPRTFDDEGEHPFDLTSFDGIKWCIESDADLFVQPFLQTAPDWTFYEPGPGGYSIPGDLASHMVTLDFNDAQNFSGLEPGNIVHPDSEGQIGANFWGLQLVGPTPAVGDELVAHIRITHWIPEPSTSVLLGLGVAGVLGWRRQRPR